MGFRMSWLLIKDRSAEDILKTLGLKNAGPAMSAVSRNEMVGYQWLSGWYVVLFGQTVGLPNQKTVAELSIGGSVVCGELNDTVCYSAASEYLDGKESWWISNEMQDKLFVSGQPPGLEEYTSKEISCVYEIPVLISENYTGFKHNIFFTEGVIALELDPLCKAVQTPEDPIDRSVREVSLRLALPRLWNIASRGDSIVIADRWSPDDGELQLSKVRAKELLNWFKASENAQEPAEFSESNSAVSMRLRDKKDYTHYGLGYVSGTLNKNEPEFNKLWLI